ncbi:MAG TPA: hypothetical protein VM327_05870 [Candidatus Thermoplasmatota archaeon]|nr:hypothetical protein [Candidatus Thermoplasmatota archaeon]
MTTEARPEGIKVPWCRPPYVVAFLLVASAVAVNAAIGNRLWLSYSLVGLVGTGTVMALDRAHRWHLPDRLLWWTMVPLAMHYLGGSLSGLHQWGTNGLYYALPWWDNLVHLLGAGAAGVGAAYLLGPRLASRQLAVFLAGCVAATLGMAVELYEFAGFLWFDTVDQGYYTNTLLDLYYNALGGFTGAWLWLRSPPTKPQMAQIPQS